MHYERRPSAWVEPVGDWGPGAVMLAEIPSADEFTDNIVAFWRPEAPLAAGSEARFAYVLSFGQDQPENAPLARVVATRSGLSILDSRERVFVVDFDLGMIDFATLNPRLEASRGEVRGLSIQRLPDRQPRAHRLPLRPRRPHRVRVPPLARERGRGGLGDLALPLERVTVFSLRSRRRTARASLLCAGEAPHPGSPWPGLRRDE